MTISVWEQAHALLGALILGAATGALYDLLRCIRWRVKSPIFCGILDLCFWLAGTAGLFVWSVRAGRGVVQLSVCCVLMAACAGYLWLLSPAVLPILTKITDLIAGLIHIIFTPVRLLQKLILRGTNFFALFFKKHFPFSPE